MEDWLLVIAKLLGAMAVLQVALGLFLAWSERRQREAQAELVSMLNDLGTLLGELTGLVRDIEWRQAGKDPEEERAQLGARMRGAPGGAIDRG